MVAIDRRRLSALGLLPIAMLEDDFRSALYQEHLLAGSVLVQRGHELVFRFERDGVGPRKRRLFGLPFQPDLGGERIERPFGRVALHLPDAFLLQQLRIVAKHGDAAHELQNRILARGLPVLQDLAPGRVALTGDAVSRFSRDGRDHHHLHQRQRAGLVGADSGYRSKRLDGGQAAG